MCFEGLHAFVFVSDKKYVDYFEMKKRKTIFLHNVQKMRAHNKKFKAHMSQYIQSTNQYSDLVSGCSILRFNGIQLNFHAKS